jgi:hypothetical protein
MALTNAEKQAAWRKRRDEELRNLQVRIWELEKKLRNLQERKERKAYHLDPEKRKHTAFHEAGHAVVGLATGLPIAIAVSVPQGSKRAGFVANQVDRTWAIGQKFVRNETGKGAHWKRAVSKKAAELDAFGNLPRENKRTPEECHAEVIMCFAGPMAEAKLRNLSDWRSLASSSDLSIARHHRGMLGDAAKSWEQYEQEAKTLVNKFWSMIEAVADRLIQVDYVTGYDVNTICARVARNGHAKRLRNRSLRGGGNDEEQK